MRMKEPMIMRTVCTKSVHMTAESPPAMVKRAAMARRKRMLRYSDSGEDLFRAS